MKSKLALALSILTLLHQAIGSENADYRNYSIPPNSKKIGPHITRNSNEQEYLYFAPGSEPSRENVVAIELVKNGVLVKRELLKNGKKHGVQREWYSNGKPKIEAPYKNGTMDGIFKVWTEKGELVGQYIMSEGNGTATVYNSVGQFAKEEHYRRNQRHGIRMERVGDKISLTQYNSGNINNGFDFFETGNIATIAFFSSDGEPNGPLVEFFEDGTVAKESWYIHNHEVTKAEYAATVDANLPPYYEDPKQYKSFVNAEILTLLEKYRTTRVKIPLEFDKNGNPVLAER